MAEDEVKNEEETVVEEPKTEESAAEEPKAEEPAVEEPKAEEPAKAEEPVAEEPKAEEPAKAEEPKPEKKAAEKPKAEAPAAPAKAEKVKRSAAIEGIMDTIKKMTVLELAELVKALEAEFGISAAAPVAVAAAPAAAAAPEVEEQTEFSVILTAMGVNKISVIKAVRELTTLGLKESKDLVEGAPKPVKEGVSKDDATAAKQKLEAAGATAEIK